MGSATRIGLVGLLVALASTPLPAPASALDTRPPALPGVAGAPRDLRAMGLATPRDSAARPYGRLAQQTATSGTLPLEVDLSGRSGVDVVPLELVTGSDRSSFAYIRKGPSFGYYLRRLEPSQNNRYDFKLYFAERASLCPAAATFDVSWAQDPDSAPQHLVTLDVCASGEQRGAVKALTLTVLGVELQRRSLYLRFDAVSGNAVLSQMRIAPSGKLGSSEQVVFADHSRIDYRHKSTSHYLPTRPLDRSRYDVREAVLSRFGSRFTVVAAPQRLGAYLSALGVDAADLSEILAAVRIGGSVAAFPLSDRYPLFGGTVQHDFATGVRFEATDTALGISASLEIRLPFWPQDESVATLPSAFLDLTLTNTGSAAITADALVATPVRYDSRDPLCSGCEPTSLTPSIGTAGVGWGALEAVGSASSPDLGAYGDSRTVVARYALAAAPSGGTEVSATSSGIVGADGRAYSSWLWPRGRGSGVPAVGDRIYRRAPRGHVGLVWSLGTLAPGASVSVAAVLAAHVSEPVVEVALPQGGSASYRFQYAATWPTLIDVVERSISERSTQLEKARRFDALVGGEQGVHLGQALEVETQALRGLQALAYRSYAANAWWLARASPSTTLPDQVFTVSEGAAACCRFQSTLDVTFNDAQFLLAFWPGLLKLMLDQWQLYSKPASPLPGKIAPHDIGSAQYLGGQVYMDMPVEENTNFVLLTYAYLKATRDVAGVSTLVPFLRELLDYVRSTDMDGNGLADVGTANTVDAANPTLFLAPDQTYLGFKTLAAYKAYLEIHEAIGYPASPFEDAVRAGVHGLLHTLSNAAWRGDHFATTLDDSGSYAELRNFGSIYPTGALTYNVQYGGDLPVSTELLDKLRSDAAAVLSRTMGPYGSVHMERGETSGWASQSIWRDTGALWIGAGGASGQAFVSNLPDYARYQHLLAREGDGGWWDPYSYSVGPDGSFEALPSAASRGVLGYYPRGAVVFGLGQAYAGITVDRVDSVLGILPWARPGARVPLYHLADWGSGEIPQARVRTGSPPTLVLSNVTPAAASMSVVVRKLEEPLARVDRDSFSPIAGDSVRIEVAPFTETVSVSMGYTGAWFVDGPATTPLSRVFDGTVAGVPVEDGWASACALPAAHRSSVLQAAGCVRVGVDSNTPGSSRNWFLAEGATDYGFESYVLISNPGELGADVAVTYMTPRGPIRRDPLYVPPKSRRTLVVAAELGRAEFSTAIASSQPVTVERAMYWRGAEGTWREGHVVAGTTSPALRWYLPEGSTDWGFDEWLLVQNPGSDVAHLQLSFSDDAGRSWTADLEAPPGTRRTVRVADIVGRADVAAEVRSDRPVVVERAMYWGGTHPAGAGGSGAMGLKRPSRTWSFAEGSTDHGFDTWLLLYNPANGVAGVDVVYTTVGGPVARRGITMAPKSRATIRVRTDIGSNDAGILVHASRPVLAERAMYWSGSGAPPASSVGGHAGWGTPSPSSRWSLAEGSTAWGLWEFVLLHNPMPSDVSVLLEFQTETGPAGRIELRIPGGSRRTVAVNDYVPNSDLSVDVRATGPVVAERAMYTRSSEGYVVMTGSLGSK